MATPHLILVPGLLCDAEVWKHQSRALESLTTIAIADHGLSDSLEKMAIALLERAPERFALAGHSMGGRVAFEVLRRAPERLAGLALLDTDYMPRRSGEAGEREQAGRYALLHKARTEGMRAMGAEWVQRMVHPERLSDASILKAILDMIERMTADIFAAQINALLARRDSAPLLPGIQCPTLVLCGRQDGWSTLARHEEMAASIPNSSLAVIESCGHMCTMERPEEVTAALTKWLRSISS